MKSQLGIAVSVFVFVLVVSALALTAFLISQYTAFNVLPLSIREAEAEAVKHKTPATEAKPFTKEDADNTGSDSFSSSSSSTTPKATSPTSSCISYNPSTRTITVSSNRNKS